MSDERVFEIQFDSQDIYNSSLEDNGSLDPIDLNYLGDENEDGRVSVSGIDAKLQAIYLYFGSLTGDYLRSDIGGPFSFVFKSESGGAGMQFRIITTVNLIISSKYPEFEVLGVDAERIKKTSGARGWKVTIVLRHESVDEDIIMNTIL